MLIDFTQKNKHRELRVTVENVKDGFDEFYKDKGYYPIGREMDSYKHLPSTKSIERKFGGMKKLREELGLEITDFRCGDTRKEMAKKCNERAMIYSKKMRKYLQTVFDERDVHIEHAMTDITNNRCDYLIFLSEKKQKAIELFYPKDRHSFIGCLNEKVRKYNKILDLIFYNVILVCMNEEFNQKEIDEIITNKKNKMNRRYEVMSLSSFKGWCEKNKK